MHFSIRLKILAGFGLILLLSSALVLFTYILSEQYIRAQRISLLSDKAQSVADTLQDYTLGIEQDYRQLANVYRLHINKDQSQFLLLVQHEIAGHDTTSELSVMSTNGRELYKFDANGNSIDSTELSIELSNQAFDQAKSGDIGVSKAYIAPGEKYPSIEIYVPISDEQGKVLAIIKGHVSLANLQDIFARLNLGKNGIAYIVDADGQVVSHPRLAEIGDQSVISNRSVVDKLLHASYQDIVPQDHYYNNEQGNAVVASSNIITSLGWVAVVEQPESEVFAQLFTIRNLLFSSLSIEVLVLIILAFILSSKLVKPIRQLRQGAEDLQQGLGQARVSVHTGDELEGLAHSFNNMADQLQQREQYLQQSNQTLKLERDRQETLLQSLTDGVFAVDALGHVLLFNKAAESITGLKAESVLNYQIDDVLRFYHNDNQIRLQDMTQQQEEFKHKLQQEGLVFHRGQTVVTVSMTTAPVSLDPTMASGWIVSFRDTTKDREFEVMKLDFVSMAAHELRTPLTALRGYLSILLDESRKDLPASSQMFLDRSLISANQLSSLVENLLNVSRIERGAMKVELVPLQMATVITDSLTNLQEVAKQKNISVSFSPPETALPLVQADQFRLTEVITNLVANGINYTKQGGWVKVALKQDGNYVVASVRDNGEGIPAASLQHLFTKFYRVQSSLAQGSKGTGLGLYISKAIIEAHHGKIWVESIEGQGSTFYFAIPIDGSQPLDANKA